MFHLKMKIISKTGKFPQNHFGLSAFQWRLGEERRDFIKCIHLDSHRSRTKASSHGKVKSKKRWHVSKQGWVIVQKSGLRFSHFLFASQHGKLKFPSSHGFVPWYPGQADSQGLLHPVMERRPYWANKKHPRILLPAFVWSRICCMFHLTDIGTRGQLKRKQHYTKNFIPSKEQYES